jgi:hypothetical protein
MQQQSSKSLRGRGRRKKRLSRSPRLLPASGPWFARASGRVTSEATRQELGGTVLLKGSSLERENIHASVCGRSEARGGLRSTRELPSLASNGGVVGSPGAHVLAVVPAHRGTYAEVRGRCWLQISSRHALQKQRSDESEREPRWNVVPGFSRGSVHRRSIATPSSGGQRPLTRRKAQGGVMSATRRHGLSREDRVACLARCGFGRPRMSGTKA